MERLRTPRLELRCWSVDDAAALVASITESLDHLRPWMPWAHHEPVPVDEKAAWLRERRRRFELGREYAWGMYDRDDPSRVLGAVALHRRIGAGAGEIGYWVHVDRTGGGLATEAAAAVTRVGVDTLGLGRIEIQCDPANAASAAIPRKLGYHHQVTIPGRVHEPGAVPRDTMIWVMPRAAFAASPAAAVPIE